MASSDHIDVSRAFAAATRRAVARRVPVFMPFSVLVVSIAGLVEFIHFPDRWPGLIASFSAEVVLCILAVTASRNLERVGEVFTEIVSLSTLGVACCMIAYVGYAGASADALAIIIIIFLTGVALFYPWGMRGQLPVAVGSLAAYLIALLAGVTGELPAAYGILGVAGGAVTSTLGAYYLQKQRHSIFRQRRMLESAREDLERRVLERTGQLERSNAELNDFAHIAAHDLREPLRGIAHYAKFLLEDYGEELDEAGVQKLETLTRLATRMQGLIGSLHEYSRVGRSELALTETTDLQEVVREVIEGMEPRIRERRVEVRAADDFPCLQCDGVRVREVFHNLLTNAIKYGDCGSPEIEIGWRMQTTARGLPEPVFWVRDNGIGIKEQYHESVFRIFKRLHGRDAYGGGTGAGLAIAKKIVDSHGGRIWLESVPGEGATFFFSLGPREPVARPAPSAQAAAAAEPSDPDADAESVTADVEPTGRIG